MRDISLEIISGAREKTEMENHLDYNRKRKMRNKKTEQLKTMLSINKHEK